MKSSHLVDELLDYIFDGQSHLLTEAMTAWLTSSRRYTTFVNTFRDKIRKKLRVTQDSESILDLRLELETAYLLLREPRFSLVYEPQLAEKVRAPDFAATFTTSLSFMVEVTRLRTDPKSTGAGAQDPDQAMPALNITERFTDAVCSKLGQLLARHSNVLLVGVERLHVTESDLRAAMLSLLQRAEQDDSAFFQRYRFRDRADFFHNHQRLSEILVRGINLQPAEPVAVWVNPQAKHPIPNKVRTVLYRSQAV